MSSAQYTCIRFILEKISLGPYMFASTYTDSCSLHNISLPNTHDLPYLTLMLSIYEISGSTKYAYHASKPSINPYAKFVSIINQCLLFQIQLHHTVLGVGCRFFQTMCLAICRAFLIQISLSLPICPCFRHCYCRPHTV